MFAWTEIYTKTFEMCLADDNYAQYSAREKMLAFTYTFLQNLQPYEPETAVLLISNSIPFLSGQNLSTLKHDFYNYADSLVFEASNSGEIQSRPFIANYYKTVLWNGFSAILLFWINDKSNHKENTDVMVEKTIHFTFDLLAPNAIDSGIDLLQNFMKLRK